MAGCGGTSQPSSGSASPAGPSVAATVVTTPQPTTAVTTVPTAAPTANPATAMNALVTASLTASYKATYKQTLTSGTQTSTNETTWYVKPPKRRIDLQSAAGLTSVYTLETGVVVCIKGVVSTCIPGSPAQGQDPGTTNQDQILKNPDQYESASDGSRAIAGQTVQCFVVKPKANVSAAFTEARTCYTAQGARLFMQTKGAGFDQTLEATAFSTTVSDDDFKPPTP
jgi:outer membrane lipoprotein-sorting protein